MKVLIENAVPLNNGDAALIFSVGEKFEQKGAEVTYSTFNYKEVIKRYPSKKWIRSKLSNKYVNKISFICKIILFFKVLFDWKIKRYQAVISAPGGYINSYYGFEMKLYLLRLYKKIYGTKIYMYSQSVGPLTAKDERILAKYLDYFDYFFVRDDISMSRVEKYVNKKIIQTKDAAFLLPVLNPKEEKEKKIAFSVRNWHHDDRNFDVYAKMIHKMIKIVIDKGYVVEFLSTCQGYTNYENDARTAEKIVATLDDNLQSKVIIDSSLYTLEELREKLTSYKFIIGTRLHMCILAWLSQVPAFNISYEEKGKECYRYLEIPQFSVDYNDFDIENSLYDFLKYDQFDTIFNKINQVQKESLIYFDLVYDDIKKNKVTRYK